jgi:hypothetical protein
MQESIVAYDEIQKPTLKEVVLLGDAIRDLPKASALLYVLLSSF